MCERCRKCLGLYRPGYKLEGGVRPLVPEERECLQMVLQVALQVVLQVALQVVLQAAALPVKLVGSDSSVK